MNLIASWWQWLGELTIIIRWPRREREDWADEQRGAVRW